jgi:hypothetical protein
MTNLQHYQPRNSDETVIINARENRIANIDSKEAYKQILSMISSVFPMYGIDGDLQFYGNIAKEIVRTFGQIAANEIEIAFRLFSAQSLDLDEDVKFYGKANMHTIGKILNAYMVYRRRIIASHDSEIEQQRHMADLEQRQAKAREELEHNFGSLLANFTGKHWEDVPLFWYDICIRKELITYADGEKMALWQEAQEIARTEPPLDKNMQSIRDHARKLEQGNQKRAVVIAQKLAVWRKVLGK